MISAMRFFIISGEPPAIIQPRVRRKQYSTSDDSLYPAPPMICIASLATSKPVLLQAALAIEVSSAEGKPLSALAAAR